MRLGYFQTLGLAVVAILTWLPLFQCSHFGARDIKPLSNEQIKVLAAAVDPVKNIDTRNPESHLSKILIPRPVDSENITLVREYIIQTLKSFDWHVEEDSFTDSTPYGERSFTNIIATKDPSALRRVILAAHYDSKYFPSYPSSQFVGATDSAAPCAMMLDLAETLNPLLDRRKQQLENDLEDLEDVEDSEDTTLQLVFFDGEEAFEVWTETDSVYGARHLAQKWATTYLSPTTKRRLFSYSSLTELATIEHLVLLDLLGAPNPSIRSYFIDTGWLFDAMVSAEQHLLESGLLDEPPDIQFHSFFLPRRSSEMNFGYIDDDHLPFLRKGVNVLHVIPYPFPSVWHTLRDDASALDIPTMRRWNLILRVFVSEYLGLQPVPPSRSTFERPHRSTNELVSFLSGAVSLSQV